MIGIYEIFFWGTNYFYIGSSNNCKRREKEHLFYLKKGTHFNPFMQRVFNKYPEKFEFRVLTESTLEDYRHLEECYLKTFKPNLNNSDKAISGPIKQPKYTYTIQDPDGKIYKIKYLTLFCTEHNLHSSQMYRCANSQAGICQGYKVTHRNNIPTNFISKQKPKKIKTLVSESKRREKISKANAKKYLITEPNGLQYCVIGLATFCRNHKKNLQSRNLNKVALGQRGHHKGFKAKLIET